MSSNCVCSKKACLKSILRGAIAAISVTLILVLAFALILRFFTISDSLIFPINQVIKIVSIFVGLYVALKKCKKNGFVNGLLLGLLYFLLSFIIFSILQNRFSISLENFYDLLLTTLMSGLIGLITVHIVK